MILVKFLNNKVDLPPIQKIGNMTYTYLEKNIINV